MAKLSARGRREVWRIEKRVRSEAGGELVTTLVLMTDGNILRNLKAITPQGKIGHNHGWGQFGKLKKLPKAEVPAQQLRVRDKYIAGGFKEVPHK
jgi:hypothetical protein